MPNEANLFLEFVLPSFVLKLQLTSKKKKIEKKGHIEFPNVSSNLRFYYFRSPPL